MQQTQERLLVDERDAARMLSVSVQLLRKWRATGDGPCCIRLGRCVRYAVSDLQRFIDSRRPNCARAAEDPPGATRSPN